MYCFEAPKDGYMEVKSWRIQMWSESEGPWCTLTINSSEADPEKGIFLVKNYSENLGVFAWLENNGFVKKVLNMSSCGDGHMILCKLDVKKIEKWNENN